MSSSRERTRAAQQRAQELQSRRDYVAALEEEKRGYQVRGLKDRAKAVDAEIAKARKGLDDDEQQEEPPSDPPAPATPTGNGSAKAALSEDNDFDPGEHDVKDVVAYLSQEDLSQEEFDRVVAAEREGKDRKTVTEFQRPQAD